MFRHVEMLTAVLFKMKSDISQCRQTDKQTNGHGKCIRIISGSAMLQLQTVKQMTSGKFCTFHELLSPHSAALMWCCCSMSTSATGSQNTLLQPPCQTAHHQMHPDTGQSARLSACHPVHSSPHQPRSALGIPTGAHPI
jgi:hypothetical protein